MMKKILFFGLLVTLFSCGESGTETQQVHHAPEMKADAKKIIPVETLFDEDQFTNPEHIKLLKELKICDEFQKDTSNYLKPACSPHFFKIFPMSDKIPVENAFLLQIKSKVGGIKLRRLLAFVREKGQLVKVNGFVANLIGFEKPESGSTYNDLILRFNDNIDGEIIFYNCLFSWNGKKYEIKKTESIEGATWRQRVKPEFMDSITKDIYRTLTENEMII